MASPAFDIAPPERFHSGLSLQGYTGILNTPTAHVTEEGFLYGQYSNQKESMWRDRTSFQDNYLFSVGAFSVAEVGGRLTYAPSERVSDLSANIKLTSEPFFRRFPYAPVIAVGYQDVGGGANLLQTKYVVVSEDLWRLRLSAGYGFGPRRMKGAFGGGEFKAHDWVYLLVENDTKETNLGARIVTPPLWKTPINLTATIKTSLNHSPGNVDIGVGLTFPLDFKRREPGKNLGEAASGSGEGVSDKNASATVSKGRESAGIPNSESAPPLPSPEPRVSHPEVVVEGTAATREVRMTALRDRLVKAGFMNVRVGSREGRTLVIEYENVTFNHNELDALGVVSGMAAGVLRDDFLFIRVIIKKKGIRMLQVSMPLPELATFVEEGRNLAELAENVAVSRRYADDTDVTFVGGDTNSSAFTAALLLWPGLTTLVGTERGAFDYVLSLKPELLVNLWKGGVVNARWDIPISWSDNLDDGKPFRNRRTPARMERLMLFQGVRLLPDVMANLGAGMVAPDLYGSLNELYWTPGRGAHAIRLVQSWGKDDKTHEVSETYLASYRYYFSPLDLFLTGTAGRFQAQDRGYMVELKRMFGDTGFSVYYKNSIARDDRHWQAAGVNFSFPLTPARDMKHYYRMQARGTDEWSYSQETVITTGSQKRNTILSFPLASIPLPTASLYDQYLNRDRLNESYIMSHLSRLREAWLSYRGSM